MDDKKLAKQLAKGNTKALEAIIEKYNGYVCTVAYNFSRGMLSNEDIDDIAVDVFCKLWNCRSNINAEIGLRSYLSAAARNLVKDRFKQKPPPCDDISELEIPSDFIVENIAELHDMINCLYKGMKQLSKDEREIFFRFYFYGEKSSQIAAANGTNKNTVDTKLHRIRKKLKDYLNERGYYYV